MLRTVALLLLSGLLLLAFRPGGPGKPKATSGVNNDSLVLPGERHLRNIRQLTFGGNNAEGYWSYDNKRIIFQSEWSFLTKQGCDQIFTVDVTQPVLKYNRISTDKGRTTCSYFLPDGRMVFASTHEANASCPHVPQGPPRTYVWPIFDSFDIYISDKDGKNLKPLVANPGYDAEATISPDGRYMVYTSIRSGDLELWRYDFKTNEHLQLTDEIGYDGGAFFSNKGNQIVYRRSIHETDSSKQKYLSILKQGMVQPGEMSIYVMDIDGKNKRRVTTLPGANWAPFFHPSDEKIIFSSNHHSLGKGGRPRFNLFMINVDGTGLEQITFEQVFDAFPMFSFDGKRIVFASNRNNKGTRDTNLFVADWVD